MSSFDHDAGWIQIPEALSADQVATVLADCQSLLQLPAEDRLARDRPHSGTRHLDGLETRVDIVAGLVADSVITEVVATLLKPTFSVDQAHYRCPQPRYGGQHLHADGLTTGQFGSTSFVTALVALVDFTEQNGATRLVPGSHLRPDLQKQSGTLKDHPDEIRLTGPAGTAFIFGGGVLHAGAQNNSDSERPALQIIWRA